jgi:hypothetical protein
VAKLCRLFRARNKRHNSERRIIPTGPGDNFILVYHQ